jgi:C-terminal processing protease CtpA/Prc
MIQNIPGNFKVRKQNLGTSESDHLTFYNINIPFLYITTEEDPVSGTIGDIATRLNYKGLADLTMYTFNIVSAMEKLPMPVFTKTKDEAVVEPTPLIVADTAPAVKSALAKESKAKAQKENAKPTTVKNPKNPTVPNTKNDKALPTIAQASKDNNSNKEKAKATIQQMQQTTSTQDQPVYKVSLGISPDLSYTEGGVRIATVSAGRAAANAGIQNGDVIVQMRDMPIQNYDNYLEALAKFSKGQKTIIKVKRNGRLQSYPVVFQ